jgi:SOS-response transcriptional repressor LexA
MIPKRLNELWKRSGYRSVTEIAKAGGWKGRSSIQRYFSAEEFKSEWLSLPVARQFVKAFKDRGKPPITEEEVLALAGPGAGTTARIVPLIELARADVWRPEEAGRWIAINRETGENAFAITILDDAMLPLYSRGEIVIADPEREAVPGHIVIAKIDGDPIPAFGQLKIANVGTRTRKELRALNPNWPYDPKPIEHIIGVVIEHHRYPDQTKP